MTLQDSLIKGLQGRTAVIGIVGLGYVGLPLALAYTSKGYKVVGLDIDTNKLEVIRSGKSYIHHIDDHDIESAVDSGKLVVTDQFAHAKDVDAIIICVPTPLNKYREPDLTYIRGTMDRLVPHLREGQVISLESTSYPGTTEEELRPAIESQGFQIGNNFFLVYSPEREDPGNPNFETSTIPKVLGGSTTSCTLVGTALYESVISEVVPVSSTRTAEMTKLLENIHRAVNIGLMNELKPLADKMNIDLYEVIKAAATKPFGFVPYYPGPGLGGHCIPIDPFYLTWKAREYGMHTRFIELAGEINTSMPNYVLQKTQEALNSASKSLNGSNILVLGVAYKKNVDDLRESPSLELIKLFTEKGSLVSFSDPYFPTLPHLKMPSFQCPAVSITQETLTASDAVVLATDHDCFDYDLILEHSDIIIDTRGRYTIGEKIVRA